MPSSSKTRATRKNWKKLEKTLGTIQWTAILKIFIDIKRPLEPVVFDQSFSKKYSFKQALMWVDK